MKQRGIRSLTSPRLGGPAAVRRYHDDLLFTAAYPSSPELAAHAERELLRVAEHVAATTAETPERFENSGIAGSQVCSTFSLDLNRWLIDRFGDQVRLYAEGLDEQIIVDTLDHLLDPVEYEMLHSGRTEWDYWSRTMTGQGADPHRIHRWIIQMADRLPGSTALKEYVFSRFGLQTLWTTPTDGLSITTGRAPRAGHHIHTDGLQRHADLHERMSGPRPRKIQLRPAERQHVIDLSRAALAHLTRETDPSTYAHPGEVLYYNMGRGMTIALFPMVPDMKMAVQSYVGFMAFKNGIPLAYGGAWLLFGESGFGVNILPPFRGGESALIVSDLLRLYHHVYNVTSFTVDPYQIGYDNPDGIASGAFWFYYRLGFRPTQRALTAQANAEWEKISRDPEYRTSREVLEELSESNMRWNVRGHRRLKPITADTLSDVVTRWVTKHHHGDRQGARADAMARIRQITELQITSRHSIGRIAVLLAACGYLDTVSRSELRRFVRDYATKLHDERQYVRASQKYTTLFDHLVAATRRR